MMKGIETDIYTWKYVKGIDKLLILLMILSAYLLKPMMLGANWTPVSMGILLFLTITYVVKNKYSYKIFILRKNIFIILAIISYFVYCAIQNLLLIGDLPNSIVKAFFSILVVAICFTILLGDKTLNYYFFKIYIITLGAFSVSYLVTFILSCFIGLDKLLVFQTTIDGYGYALKIYFPFTSGTGTLPVAGMQIIRNSALLRECGITQLFYLWAFASSDRFFRNSKYIKALMIIGTISCFSTTGYINLLFVFCFLILANYKKLRTKNSKIRLMLSLIALITFYWGFNNIEGIRMEDKADVSYNARIDKLYEGLDLLQENPLFGVGYSNAYVVGTSTSFLQRSYTIGLFGLFLYLNIFIVAYAFTRMKSRYVLAILPLIVTVLFAQPIDEACLIFILLIYNYDTNYIIKTSERSVRQYNNKSIDSYI